MKKHFFLLALLIAGAAFAESVILYHDDFEGYTEGPWLGQGNTEVMQSTVHSGPYEAPAEGEVEIVNEDGNNFLSLKKKASPEGVTKPGKDRGVRVPLNWGSVDYNGGVDGVIIIIGKVRIPNGNGYAEVRLATSNDDPMMRFCVHSSDYRTYCYTNNRRSAPNSGAANYGDARWPSGSADKIQYTTNEAVVRDTWCNFMLAVDCHTGTLTEYYISDGADFSFRGEKVCQLYRFQDRPAYAEFTAVGNGYDTNRDGACFDNLYFYYINTDTPWVTVLEDDFESYEVGESLTEQASYYQRLGDEPTFSDLIVNDETYGKCAKLWINTPTGYPKDGIKIVNPSGVAPAPLSKMRVTVKYYCPDNGCWTKFMNGPDVLATYGFHSANQWFATWGSDDASPRYDAMESSPYRTFVETTMTVTCDEEGIPSLDSIAMRHDSDSENKWGLKWSKYFDTTLSDAPDTVAFQVQGWNEFDGRYMTISNIKVEYAAPEPAFLGLLALVGLAFLRKQR